MIGPARSQPTFHQVYTCLQRFGPATVISSRGTQYEVHAVDSSGRPTIVGYLRRGGQVRIHEDCWGSGITCQGTRAGGLLNGNPSLYDWYHARCGSRSSCE